MGADSAAPAHRLPAQSRTSRLPSRSRWSALPAAHAGDEETRLLASLTAARAGNAVAFEAIYRALAPRLLRYARGLVGQDADDVAAEAWLQIVRDLARFDGDWDAFRGWAARILRNRAIDHRRAAARRPVRSSTPLDALLDRASDDDPASEAEEALSTAAAIELIASLPPDQAEAVLLRAVVGLEAKAAGQVLGKRAGAVRVAAHRGLKTLATRLDSASASNGDRSDGAGEVT